jgi:hypothetical protein
MTPTLPIDTATSPDDLHRSYGAGRPRRDLHRKRCGARPLEAMDICRRSIGRTGACGDALNLGVAAIAVYLGRRH